MSTYRELEYVRRQLARVNWDWEQEPEPVYVRPADILPEEWNWKGQRARKPFLSQEMADVFLPLAAHGFIVIVDDEGRRYFVDGLTRLSACHLAGHDGLWGWQFRGTEEQAYMIFLLKNDKGIRLVRAIEASIRRAGSGDPEALAIAGVLGEHGCELHERKAEGHITSGRSVEVIYRAGGESLLSRVLEMITAAWGRDRRALQAEVLEGMALLLAHNGEWFEDRQHWREAKERFHKQHIDDLLDSAISEHRKGHGGTRAVYIEAELVDLYNLKRQEGNRLPELKIRVLARERPSLADLAAANKPARPTPPVSAAGEVRHEAVS